MRKLYCFAVKGNVQCSAVQCNTGQYSTVSYINMDINTCKYSAMQCNAVQCIAVVFFFFIQFSAVQFYTMQLILVPYNTEKRKLVSETVSDTHCCMCLLPVSVSKWCNTLLPNHHQYCVAQTSEQTWAKLGASLQKLSSSIQWIKGFNGLKYKFVYIFLPQFNILFFLSNNKFR